jgi:hypothetical protein
MKLTAQRPESLLEIRGGEVQPARQTEETEIVAVTAQREDLRALRAEMDVDRSAAAAVLARLKRKR